MAFVAPWLYKKNKKLGEDEHCNKRFQMQDKLQDRLFHRPS